MREIDFRLTDNTFPVSMRVDTNPPVQMGMEQVRIVKGNSVYLDTTENWNAKRSYRPLRGDIIVYTDHGQIVDVYGETVNVPGVKIGDGNAYLIDLPFVGADVRYQILTELREHTGNTGIHVTPEEKEFWNNKLNCTVNDGNLVLNRL